MNDQELRDMVRESIARHTGGRPIPPPMPANADHASFARLPLARGADDDGACIIEPTVRCNHCGFCQSYGH
jgi:hypothetical protein